ncbi:MULTISPECIES: bifunctional 2-polyprenyl-6-hydroxyphenol methylase/3-demethylubiquinol 3-O-methyltransferase UbiG [unclassified Wenzhouxiangella]|uniref:class I SAM-dependent methyltransferase n=1 Tax=unclassified Wenzhouxiangella TaxID=2613841 RepID=UPI000E32B0E4|nr:MULTISPECIES: class I SAM-dependent methyltransferase [unclassified Wenzhouxiangella]RFF27232.1 class I SAM-dependent methyltransferase [Wenzhouxiangella sp. 15181]RFP69712.1 class I SAM-dependent methyltransferase [Wenzhouxiangella sp. 15190]
MSDDWYLDDDFWRNFGSLMFNADTFARGSQEVQQLLALLGSRPQTVLDLGCGPGRHALPLADAGLAVTAVDTSPSLLEQLETERGERAIEIVEADMREFVRPQTFDVVIVMWTSFGYFTDEADHRRVLTNIRDSLKPGGRLVLDLVGLEYLCRNLQPVHLTEYDDGRILVERPDLTEAMTRLENQWMLIDGDRVHYHEFSHRVWSAGEIRSLLQDAGLSLKAVYGSYDGDEYDLDAERMIVIAG